ncbi:MAG TPA: SPFH domain-containing protein, partial [Kineosporiaceae bacterium]
DPPGSIQEAMEKQMRAERDRRAAILNAEGVKQSQILTAEGDRQSAILRAEGQAQAAVLKAQGEARAIQQVFAAIHRGNPDSKLLAYQYLQVLPQIAQSPSNKVWIVPTELTQALRGIGTALGGGDDSAAAWAPSAGTSAGPPEPEAAAGSGSDAPGDGVLSGTVPSLAETALEDPAEALRRAKAEVAGAEGTAAESSRMRQL